MILSLSEVPLPSVTLNRDFIKNGFQFHLNTVSFGEQIAKTPFSLHTTDQE